MILQEEIRIQRERERRATSLLPVRIRGNDTKGNHISQVACTLNVSHGGARLVGLFHRLKVGSIVWLRYYQEEIRYRVVWARRDGTHWQAGLRSLESAERMWGVELGCGFGAGGLPPDAQASAGKILKDLGSSWCAIVKLSIPIWEVVARYLGNLLSPELCL